MWIEYLLLFLMHVGEYSKYIKDVGMFVFRVFS